MLCCGSKQKSMVSGYKQTSNRPRNLKSSGNTNKKQLANNNTSDDQKIVEQIIIDHEVNRINQKYQFPASFKKAKLHFRAVKFGYNADTVSVKQPAGASGIHTADSREPANQRPKVCPCCCQRINTKSIDICYPTTNPEIHRDQFLLSSSSALFFSFIKMTILYFVILFLVCGVFNLLTSLDGNYCIRNPKVCTKTVFELISTYNKHKDPKVRVMLQIQNIICLASVILSIVFFTVYKKKRYQIYSKIDEKHQTQDDYTIFIEKIPILDFSHAQNAKQMNQIDFNYQQNLKNIFEEKIQSWLTWMKDNNQNQYGPIEKDLVTLLKKEQQGRQSKEQQRAPRSIDDLKNGIKVTSISLCFNLSQVHQINKQRQILMDKHINSLKKHDGSTIDRHQIQNQIKALNLIELNLCEKFASDDSPTFNITHFLGKAFISFEYQHFREYIMQKYEDGSKQFKYGDTNLVLSRASHPTDIKWLNMEYSDMDRLKRMVISYLIIGMILVFSAAALIGIDFLKLNGIKEGKDISPETTVLNYSLTILGSVITSLINNGIWYIISGLSGYQKHQTLTNKIASQIIKTIIAQLINTVLILYLIQVFNQRPYLSSAGLVVQASTYIVVSGFISIITNAISFRMWVRYAMLWWNYGYYSKQSMEERESIQTYQVKLNKDYELPIFDITGRYIWYLLQIYTCMFYCYLVPVGLLTTAAIFGIQYWIDKVKLLKFSSEYKELGYFLSRVIFKVFEGSLLVFTVGNLIFSTVIYGKIDIINIISLGIAFVYTCIIVFASQTLERKLFDRYETFEKNSYSKCQMEEKFIETYWTQNPATMFAQQQDINNSKGRIEQKIMYEYFGEEQLRNEAYQDPNDWYVEDQINHS